MEERKNNTGLAVLITILVIAILGLTCFIVYDKVLKKDKTESNTTENGENEEKSADVENKLSESEEQEIVNNLVESLSIDHCGAYKYNFTNGKKITKSDLTDDEIFSILFMYKGVYKKGTVNKQVIINAYEEFFKDTIYNLPKKIHIKFYDYELKGDFYENYASGGACDYFSRYVVDSYNFNDNKLSINVIYTTEFTDYDSDIIYIKGKDNFKIEKITQEVGEYSTDEIKSIKDNKNSFITYKFNFNVADSKYSFDSIEKLI